MPFIYSAGHNSMAATYLIGALLHPNLEAPFAHIGKTQLASLRQLATLLQALLNKPGSHPRVL